MIWQILVLVLILAVIAIYLASTAGRLDRLHKRVDTGLEALEVQLRRRSAISQQLATSDLLDPGTCIVLGEAASIAAEDERNPVYRAHAESDLSAVLEAIFDSREEVEALAEVPGGQQFVTELAGAVHRVELSRRFYNDAVRACRAVRRQFLVRSLGLAGHTELPQMVEMADQVPLGLQDR